MYRYVKRLFHLLLFSLSFFQLESLSSQNLLHHLRNRHRKKHFYHNFYHYIFQFLLVILFLLYKADVADVDDNPRSSQCRHNEDILKIIKKLDYMH